MDVRRSLLVELEDDQGVVGLGESAPFEEHRNNVKRRLALLLRDRRRDVDSGAA